MRETIKLLWCKQTQLMALVIRHKTRVVTDLLQDDECCQWTLTGVQELQQDRHAINLVSGYSLISLMMSNEGRKVDQ